jgi:DNA invertase Pin-like site-specific DNA recombinase
VKAAAYVRVSSATQTAEMQRDAIRRAAKQRGDVIVEWFEDKQSGKTLARPALDRVRQLAREGLVSKVYVWKLDRLTRSGIVDTISLVKELREHGCALVSLSDAFHFEGPAGEMILAILAGAAQIELAANRERRDGAREAMMAAGRAWGRPRRMSGSLIERASALAARGKSVRAIAVALKVPRATIDRALRRLKSPPRKTPASTLEKAAKQKSVPPPSR